MSLIIAISWAGITNSFQKHIQILKHSVQKLFCIRSEKKKKTIAKVLKVSDFNIN